MDAAAQRASQQQDVLNKRIAELDAECRKLRDTKYQLDSQARLAALLWLRPALCQGARMSVSVGACSCGEV
jgi:hypothetical protein